MLAKSRSVTVAPLHCALAVAALCANIICTGTAAAANVTVNAVTSGFYVSTGSAFSGGYFVGNSLLLSPPGEYRAYVSFSLAGISDPVTAATLRLSMPNGGYISPDATEGVGVFDVSTNLALLTSGSGGVGAFADLGTGLQLGSTTVSSSSNGTNIDFTLNLNGINYINAGLGNSIAVGLAGTTLSFSSSATEVFFNNSGAAGLNRQLLLVTSPIPEPATALVMAVGLALMLGRVGVNSRAQRRRPE